ncbi:MAG: protein-glutamine glutaminase family protein [Bacteroidota bacterium]|nr:protein-glutamine glutaminase family protein [Bacteroidota bacterium]
MLSKTVFTPSISDKIRTGPGLSIDQAAALFVFFKHCSLFRWSDANNDCEDRANAICILLDEWGIANCKGWVFSGYVFRKAGYLKNMWKYHVASAVPVSENGNVTLYIIDPATSESLVEVADWAANVTDNPHSYYLLKTGTVYIFPKNIAKDKWYERNKRNYNWTMQGLSGINGLSTKGKAQLRFNKKKLLRTRDLFHQLRKTKPLFLSQIPG